MFDSHSGQADFSACLVWICTHSDTKTLSIQYFHSWAITIICPWCINYSRVCLFIGYWIQLTDEESSDLQSQHPEGLQCYQWFVLGVQWLGSFEINYLFHWVFLVWLFKLSFKRSQLKSPTTMSSICSPSRFWNMISILSKNSIRELGGLYTDAIKIRLDLGLITSRHIASIYPLESDLLYL